MRPSLPSLVLAAAALVAPAAAAQDTAAVAATVDAFHAALARGDSTGALALLAPDVIILESGDREDLTEYRAHHLAADIEFSRGVPSTPGSRAIVVQGETAWVSATSRSSGTFRGRSINSAGAETMVLSRTRDGWRIRAIHWSSHAIRPPAGG